MTATNTVHSECGQRPFGRDNEQITCPSWGVPMPLSCLSHGTVKRGSIMKSFSDNGQYVPSLHDSYVLCAIYVMLYPPSGACQPMKNIQ